VYIYIYVCIYICIYIYMYMLIFMLRKIQLMNRLRYSNNISSFMDLSVGMYIKYEF